MEHEVADAADKRDVVREALRVLRKGGAFAFQDYFREPKYYGDASGLLRTLRDWGIDSVSMVGTRELVDVPVLMRGRRVLGRTAVMWGVK